MVVVEERIAAGLSVGEELTLDALGGEEELWRAADELTRSRFLPELVRILGAEWEGVTDHEGAVSFLDRSLREVDHALTMANTVEALLENGAVLAAAGEIVGRALLARTENPSRRLEPVIARHALGGAVRLSLGGWMNAFPLLVVLSELDRDEDPEFATAAARYLGLCYEQYRHRELRETLRRLRELPDCEADAAFELAMTELVDALERSAPEEITAGILEARAGFASTAALEEERHDAEVLGLALDILLAFLDERPAADLHEKAEALGRMAWLRQAWLSGMHESWLAPRATAEVEWYRLATLLAEAASLLERPSWLDARKALAQIVDAYSASRSVRLFVRAEGYEGGLDQIVEPRITAAFIRSAGLRAHLEEWLREESVGEAPGAAARLLEQVEAAERKKARRRRFLRRWRG